MVSLSEREELRSTCSVISASTMSVLAGAAGLLPKSTSMTRPPAFGGRQHFQRASPIQRAAGSAKSRSQSTRSTTRLPPSAARRSSIFLPIGAEFRIGRVAQRQHAELDAVEARRALAHQLVIDAHGARRRIALAPGGGDDDELLGGGERGRSRSAMSMTRRLEAVLARRLGNVAGELFGIAGLARIRRWSAARPAAPAPPAAPRCAPPAEHRGRPESPASQAR